MLIHHTLLRSDDVVRTHVSRISSNFQYRRSHLEERGVFFPPTSRLNRVTLTRFSVTITLKQSGNISSQFKFGRARTSQWTFPLHQISADFGPLQRARLREMKMTTPSTLMQTNTRTKRKTSKFLLAQSAQTFSLTPLMVAIGLWAHVKHSPPKIEGWFRDSGARARVLVYPFGRWLCLCLERKQGCSVRILTMRDFI